MFLISLYFRMLRLDASNSHLLFMYYNLFYLATGQEGKSIKIELSRRILQREKFQKELKECIREIRQNKIGFPFELLEIILPWWSKLDYLILKSFSPSGWEMCQNCELDNINKYYKVLNVQMNSVALNNLLLEQKSEVEIYVMSKL